MHKTPLFLMLLGCMTMLATVGIVYLLSPTHAPDVPQQPVLGRDPTGVVQAVVAGNAGEIQVTVTEE